MFQITQSIKDAHVWT